ncbi:restriction endonuclease subunit S [Proteus mirabilis]|uniref:restriction endonuclease subunit S n=1 Tax=Morganellaceae TaxID=1903414 RepID=UPI0018C80AFB|nr:MULTISPECIES: restriction endonuclease subunit S [Morganellaceae]EHZ8012949.1 restriction endonuclease subunit S [Proteus mirabilis]EKV2708086.1 restriction endonuclease subunit S [Proteus mirabilis]EMB4673055.1 restriction endonuclease subunit S [Proteus mirabilis]MBG2816145.1 restriction endonuclease subunit S [Proteus mirabilis]MCT8198983.1 restriction endonuclease subunit S [Proteus mirabilis]
MTNYESLPLGELGKIVTGKTPKTENPENFGADYMFIGPTDLHKHFFITSSERMISAKGLESIKSSALNGVSVLVGCIGWDMGNVGVVEGKCATNQQINSITNIHENYNPLYIYYWLKTKKDFLYQQASVTRTPILNKTDFSSIRINIPKERKYQDKVVGLLAAIDKKIELNNRINAELEAMAKTLYDYWFVQFDFPDANGKPYKTSGGKMVYNPTLKREIPEGWEAVSVGNIVDIKTGKEDANYATENGKYHFFTCGESALRCDDFVFKGKAVLLAGNGSFSVKRYEGKFNAYQRTYVLIPKQDELYAPLYFAVNDKVKTLTSGSRGSIVKFITKGDIEDIYLPLPRNRELDFVKTLNDCFKESSRLYEQNLELVSLRDWLLPMLMNGQVTVGEAN